MQIEPARRVYVALAKKGLGVNALTRVAPVKPAQERSLPPLIVHRHEREKASPDSGAHEEKRHEIHLHGERRTYCRRFEHLPVLEELRSGRDRRRNKQRKDDEADHIDENV